jgi:hypothetical protein
MSSVLLLAAKGIPCCSQMPPMVFIYKQPWWFGADLARQQHCVVERIIRFRETLAGGDGESNGTA